MRNWILITALATVISAGGLVYYVFPPSLTNAPNMPPQVLVQPEQKTGNPLLTANSMQFDMWVGRCQAELYGDQEYATPHMHKSCLITVRQRVESNTGVRLRDEDIIAPAVVAHWKAL